ARWRILLQRPRGGGSNQGDSGVRVGRSEGYRGNRRRKRPLLGPPPNPAFHSGSEQLGHRRDGRGSAGSLHRSQDAVAPPTHTHPAPADRARFHASQVITALAAPARDQERNRTLASMARM